MPQCLQVVRHKAFHHRSRRRHFGQNDLESLILDGLAAIRSRELFHQAQSRCGLGKHGPHRSDSEQPRMRQ